MSNETFTNRVLYSDSADRYRKSNEGATDFGQVHFIDELLSIGQFESRQLELQETIPAPQQSSLSERNSSIENDPEERSEDESEETTPWDADRYAIGFMQSNFADGKTDDLVKRQDDSDALRPLQAKKEANTNDFGQVEKKNSLNSESDATSSAETSIDQAVVLDTEAKSPRIGSDEQESTQVQANELVQDAEGSGWRPVEDSGKIDVELSSAKQSRIASEGDSGRSSESTSSTPGKSDVTPVGPSVAKSSFNATAQASDKSDRFERGSENEDTSEVKPSRSRRAERLARDRESDRIDDSSESRNVDDSETAGSYNNPDTNSRSQPNIEKLAVSSVDQASFVSSTTFASGPTMEAAGVSPIQMQSLTPALSGAVTSSPERRTITEATPTGRTSVVAATELNLGSQLNSAATSTVTSTTAAIGRANASTATTGRSAGSITPYQEVKLVQRVLRGLEQLGDGGGQVKLRLHPPELGTLQLTLRMESGQMFAKMEVENTMARDALLGNVQTLKDRLATQGMQIETFEVQVASDSSNSSSGSHFDQQGFGSDSRWDQANSRYAEMNRNRIAGQTAIDSKTTTGISWTRKNGSLDVTV